MVDVFEDLYLDHKVNLIEVVITKVIVMDDFYVLYRDEER